MWVEPLFGEAKDWHGLRRFRLRRLWKVNTEALLIVTGHNLKRLLRKRGWGRRPWPHEASEALATRRSLTKLARWRLPSSDRRREAIHREFQNGDSNSPRPLFQQPRALVEQVI